MTGVPGGRIRPIPRSSPVGTPPTRSAALRREPDRAMSPGRALDDLITIRGVAAAGHAVNLAKNVYADVLVLSPSGRLDHDNCAPLQVAISEHLDQGARAVVFDLSGLEYVSSAGLRCFMLVAKEVRMHGGRTLVAAMQPVVAEILEISRFNLILDAFPTVRAALEAISPASVRAYDRA